MGFEWDYIYIYIYITLMINVMEFHGMSCGLEVICVRLMDFRMEKHILTPVHINPSWGLKKTVFSGTIERGWLILMLGEYLGEWGCTGTW